MIAPQLYCGVYMRAWDFFTWQKRYQISNCHNLLEEIYTYGS